MHQVEFAVLVQHDENRVIVATGLRNEFQRYAGSLGPVEAADLMSPNASVFEVLVGLACEGNDMIPLRVQVWFHIFLENLGLTRYTDEHIEGRAAFQVEKIIHRFNNRQYRPNGRGGIFPLSHPPCDQREIELWYQMGIYITQEGMY